MTWTLTLAGWVVLGLATAVAGMAGVLSNGRFPSLGDVLAFLMRARVGRWFVMIGWLWLGWHLFVRSGAPGF
ncbi:MAG TPA: DUF6186 family protein [Actinomycetes bacterium]|jgi:hypothetical protein|nr:DUF6186 family protein [Actinomycetes bacterium]